MTDEYSGIHDNAVGRSIENQQERIQDAKYKREMLTELKEQLEIVAEHARVIANPRPDNGIDITVKSEHVHEELEILVGMDSMNGNITFVDSENCFKAELIYYYKE